jgi:hypothetical protein
LILGYLTNLLLHFFSLLYNQLKPKLKFEKKKIFGRCLSQWFPHTSAGATEQETTQWFPDTMVGATEQETR